MHSETIDTGVVWVAMVTGDVKSHITENFLVVFLYKTQYPILNFSHKQNMYTVQYSTCNTNSVVITIQCQLTISNDCMGGS